jgi:hypothetical protein
MATLRERTGRHGDTTYTAMVRRAGFPTRTATFNTRAKAVKWAATADSEMIAGRQFRDASAYRHTVAEAIDRYMKEEVPKTRRRRRDAHTACPRFAPQRQALTVCQLQPLVSTGVCALPPRMGQIGPSNDLPGHSHEAPTVVRRKQRLRDSPRMRRGCVGWSEEILAGKGRSYGNARTMGNPVVWRHTSKISDPPPVSHLTLR